MGRPTLARRPAVAWRQASVVAGRRGLATTGPRGLAQHAPAFRAQVRAVPSPLPGFGGHARRALRWLPLGRRGWGTPVREDRDRPHRARDLPDRACRSTLRVAVRRRDGGRRSRRRRRLRDPRPGARLTRGPATRTRLQRDGGAARHERDPAPAAPRRRRARAPDAPLGDPREPRGHPRRPVPDGRGAAPEGARGNHGDGAAPRRPADPVDRGSRRPHAASRADRAAAADRRGRRIVHGAGTGEGGPARGTSGQPFPTSRWTGSGSERC